MIENDSGRDAFSFELSITSLSFPEKCIAACVFKDRFVRNSELKLKSLLLQSCQIQSEENEEFAALFKTLIACLIVFLSNEVDCHCVRLSSSTQDSNSSELITMTFFTCVMLEECPICHTQRKTTSFFY